MKGLKNTLGAIVVCATVVGSMNATKFSRGFNADYKKASFLEKLIHPSDVIAKNPLKSVAAGVAAGAAAVHIARKTDMVNKLWNCVPEKVKAFFAKLPNQMMSIVPKQTKTVIAAEATGAAALLALYTFRRPISRLLRGKSSRRREYQRFDNDIVSEWEPNHDLLHE